MLYSRSGSLDCIILKESFGLSASTNLYSVDKVLYEPIMIYLLDFVLYTNVPKVSSFSSKIKTSSDTSVPKTCLYILSLRKVTGSFLV